MICIPLIAALIVVGAVVLAACLYLLVTGAWRESNERVAHWERVGPFEARRRDLW